ncbi:hypothetical protein GCM10011494_09730 [Novosphingobium endophyticum]|uniref:Flagellar hook-length control protein FliK n=1 Tax=Novosphingobium endophyticum TaxID=1955250 RepID=A0A916X4I2_9SPHN|nr:hypothetical protein [Novosphingobium endophyticum]GGB93376.1 hypothetical protein GCM10011494_09730 [Novosphingobium endophyticum]
MVNREVQQGMIQVSAPLISANAPGTNGMMPSASAQGAESAGFAALLGAAGSLTATPETAAQDMAAAIAASLAGLPSGNAGKEGGKTLPVAAPAVAGTTDTGLAIPSAPETHEAPDDAASDQADVPIAAAIPVLPLIVPPLPGNDSPVEFRAAGPVSAAPAPAIPRPTLPEATAQVTRIMASVPIIGQAAADGIARAQVMRVSLSPIILADAQPQVGGEAPPAASATTFRSATASAAQMPVPGMTGAATTPAMAARETVPAATVRATPEIANNAAPTAVAEPVAAVTIRPAPASAATTTAPATAEPATAADTRTASAASGTAGGDERAASAAPRIFTPAPSPVIGAQAAPATAPEARVMTTDARAEPKASAPAMPASPMTAEAPSGPEVTSPAIQSAPQQPLFNLAQAAAAARPADPALAATSAPASAEQPHDFATLVERLTEAREAASPQVVRTALQHAEFGRVSLQFRHDDAKLSVTMANADPGFTSAVQTAVAASLAGHAAGNGEQQRGEGQQNQQQQQQQSAAQQQSASSGNGQGQQQAAQARAEQGERAFHRGQASSAGAQQDRTGSSGRTGTDNQRSGIYA